MPTSEPPPTLFIQGDSATGKSLIVKSCLDVGKFCYALVNCGEGYSLKLLFESILNQIAKHKLTEENSFQPYAKCNNFLEFVINLQSISEKFNVGKLNDNKSLSVIIVSTGLPKGLDCTVLFKKIYQLCYCEHPLISGVRQSRNFEEIR